MRYSAFLPSGMLYLMCAGKVAPPRPTMPISFSLATISLGSRVHSRLMSGVRSMVSIHSSPSTVIYTAGLAMPKASLQVSTFSTVPLTGECTLAHMNVWASPISWPTFTLSPFCTTGVAGAPRCWFISTTICLPTGITSMAASLDILFSSGCTPPIRNVFISVLCLVFCVQFFTSTFSATGISTFSTAGAAGASAGLGAGLTAGAGKPTSLMALVGHSVTHLRQAMHFL